MSLWLATAGAVVPVHAEMLPLLGEPVRSQFAAVGAVNFAGFKTTASCSGALVAPDLVLTAAHCVQGPEQPAPFPGSRQFVAGLNLDTYVANRQSVEIMVHPAYALASDSARFRYDIALIRLVEPIPTAKVRPLKIAQGAERRPGPFAILGYSRFRPYVLSGRFDCMRSNGVDALELLTDCEVVGGNSGSPVLAQVEGEWQIVSVVVATLTEDGEKRSLAVPVLDWVLDHVAEARKRTGG
jgi:V8-like Glu-specific endopeptidase